MQKFFYKYSTAGVNTGQIMKIGHSEGNPLEWWSSHTWAMHGWCVQHNFLPATKWAIPTYPPFRCSSLGDNIPRYIATYDSVN